MLQMLNRFFDRAIYYAAVGYEREVAETTSADTCAMAGT
jgi:hypothetical protein